MANIKKPEKNQQKNPKQSGGCCQPSSQEKSKQPQQPAKKPHGK